MWIPGWKQTTSFDIPRAGAAVVAADDFIYLIGGVDGKQFLDTTIYARIHGDGSLGPWQKGPLLSEPRGFVGAVYHKGYIYVVGGGNGQNGENLLRSVERAPIERDGSLGSWVRLNNMVMPRRCSKLVVSHDSIYSFGGYGGALLDTVEKAEFKDDGSLGEWKLEPEKMTIPRYVNGVKKWNNAIYVIGGHDQSKGVGITDVEWTNFSSHSLEKWKKTNSLHTGRYGLTVATHKGYIYALGGISGAEYLDSIEKSKVNNNGGLDKWEMTSPLMEPRATFNAVVYKNWIYILGGTNRDGYLTSVEYASFNEKGDIGFWGNQSEASAYQNKLEAQKIRKKNLPNEGIVKKVIHASAYSYVQVVTKDGLVWLAGPKTDLKIGSRIRYSKGVLMSNFFSKELQRNFPAVIFVGVIQPEQGD